MGYSKGNIFQTFTTVESGENNIKSFPAYYLLTGMMAELITL